MESCLTQHDFWSQLTSLDKKEQGMAVALSLPYKSEFGNDIQIKVLESVDKETLKAEDSLQKLIDFLKKTLGNEDIEDISQKWDEFETRRRKERRG